MLDRIITLSVLLLFLHNPVLMIEFEHPVSTSPLTKWLPLTIASVVGILPRSNFIGLFPAQHPFAHRLPCE